MELPTFIILFGAIGMVISLVIGILIICLLVKWLFR